MKGYGASKDDVWRGTDGTKLNVEEVEEIKVR